MKKIGIVIEARTGSKDCQTKFYLKLEVWYLEFSVRD